MCAYICVSVIWVYVSLRMLMCMLRRLKRILYVLFYSPHISFRQILSLIMELVCVCFDVVVLFSARLEASKPRPQILALTLHLESWGFRHTLTLLCGWQGLNSDPHNCTVIVLNHGAVSLTLCLTVLLLHLCYHEVLVFLYLAYFTENALQIHLKCWKQISTLSKPSYIFFLFSPYSFCILTARGNITVNMKI